MTLRKRGRYELLLLVTIWLAALALLAAGPTKAHYVPGDAQAVIADSTARPGTFGLNSQYWPFLAFGFDSVNMAVPGSYPTQWLALCTPLCTWTAGFGPDDALWIELGHNDPLQDPVLYKMDIEDLVDLWIVQTGSTHVHLVIPPYSWDTAVLDRSAQRAWQDEMAEALYEICDFDPAVECTVDLRGATSGWAGHFDTTEWTPPQPPDGVHHGITGMEQVAHVIIVPEPKQWALFGTGVALLGLLARRRRGSQP